MSINGKEKCNWSRINYVIKRNGTRSQVSSETEKRLLPD